MSLIDYVTSFIDGRIRFRHRALRDEAVADRLKAYLSTLPGVRSTEVNTRTGSVLLDYDPDVLDRKTLLGLAGQAESFLAREK